MLVSDYSEWSCRHGVFDAHEPVAFGGREGVCAESVPEWGKLRCDWFAGDTSRVARRAPCCVVRVAVGGVAGRRILGLTPEPARWSAWSDWARDYRNVRGLPIEFADTHGDAEGRLVQHAKPLSDGGELEVCLSPRSARMAMSSSMTLRGAAQKYEPAVTLAEVQ